MPKYYICKKHKFRYRFKPGILKSLPKKAAKELKKCPECHVKMEVGK